MGVFVEATTMGAWGFVIRDSAGTIRGSGFGRLEHVASTAQTEAVACSEALHAAEVCGMGKVFVEVDA